MIRTKPHVHEFLELIRANLTDAPEPIEPEQAFREHRSWSSMQALILVVSLDEHYAVTINEEDLRQAHTWNNLYELVIQKMD